MEMFPHFASPRSFLIGSIFQWNSASPCGQTQATSIDTRENQFDFVPELHFKISLQDSPIVEVLFESHFCLFAKSCKLAVG
jgi:hypothetical protein